MNKNYENYKSTYSQLRPSDESIERALNMTQKREHGFTVSFKRLAAGLLALVLLISGGFGVNYAFQKNNKANEFGVVVAYASTGDYVKVGSENKQKLFYGLYLAPADDKEEADRVEKRWRADYEAIREEFDKLGDEGYSASISGGAGGHPCYNSDGKEVAMLRSLQAGYFALSLDDYSDVKTFKVENNSKYGYLEFDYLGHLEKMFEMGTDGYYEEGYEPTDQDSLDFYGWGHSFEISGDELRRSQQSDTYAGGMKPEIEVNKGYRLSWIPSLEFENEVIPADPHFDLSQIQDTITFTVTFNDGTVKTASLDIQFDSDGYMHFENQSAD